MLIEFVQGLIKDSNCGCVCLWWFIPGFVSLDLLSNMFSVALIGAVSRALIISTLPADEDIKHYTLLLLSRQLSLNVA